MRHGANNDEITMELTASKNRSIAIARNNALCNNVALRYGNAVAMHQRWNYGNIQPLAMNIEKSVSADVPAFALMIATYGVEEMEINLRNYVRGFLLEQGETRMTDNDCIVIARNIIASKEFRLLNYAFVVNFFAELAQGKWEFFPTPRAFMVQFQHYAKSALQRQNTLQIEHETRQRAIADAQRASNAITFEQWKERTGNADAENPIYNITTQR